MPEYRFTEYFDNEVLRKRPYLQKQQCIRFVNHHRRQGDDSQRVSRQAVQTMKLKFDYDAGGILVGIDIDNASTKVDLRKLIVSKPPGPVETSVG